MYVPASSNAASWSVATLSWLHTSYITTLPDSASRSSSPGGSPSRSNGGWIRGGRRWPSARPCASLAALSITTIVLIITFETYRPRSLDVFAPLNRDCSALPPPISLSLSLFLSLTLFLCRLFSMHRPIAACLMPLYAPRCSDASMTAPTHSPVVPFWTDLSCLHSVCPMNNARRMPMDLSYLVLDAWRKWRDFGQCRRSGKCLGQATGNSRGWERNICAFSSFDFRRRVTRGYKTLSVSNYKELNLIFG